NNESAPNSQRSSEKPTAPTASHETSAEPTRSESASNQGTPQI
uniref:Uncharacterized protein n=1 Tax=Caenorhabditis japonica TaxID=281687 RepID=A0A8R1ESP3_CAEJA